MNASLFPTPARVTRSLVSILGLLFSVAALFQIAYWSYGWENPFGIARIFNMDHEMSLPNWFSTVLLAWIGLLALVAGRAAPALRVPWTVAAVLAFGLSAEETLSLHEHFNQYRHFISGPWGYYPWTIGAAPLVLIVALSSIHVLRKLPSHTALQLIMAGGLYVSGALGLELLAGWWLTSHPGISLFFTLCTMFEESLEMLGLILAQHALLDYIVAQSSESVVRTNMRASENRP